MTFALIPAGGHSRRMGRPKLTLPLGGCTVLELVVAALRRAGVEHVLVVVGRHVPELVPLSEGAGAHAYLLAEETADMRATVEQGLRWLEERFRPRAEDDWLLVPGDHPALDAEVIRRLLQARAAHPHHSIFIPTWAGRRGHPALVGWKHVAGIRALPPNLGLNRYWRQRAEETLELPVDTAAVLCDLDTPEDYERLRQTWPNPSSSPGPC
jgi:CTP:molybdopterin cytidylyltransferase MocA